MNRGLPDLGRAPRAARAVGVLEAGHTRNFSGRKPNDEALDCGSSTRGFDSHPSLQLLLAIGVVVALVRREHEAGVRFPHRQPLKVTLLFTLNRSMNTCQYCGAIHTKQSGLKNHELRCSKNLNRNPSIVGGFRNHVPWNKGKSKETDARLASVAPRISNTLKGRPTHVWTDEQRRAQSERKKKLFAEHPEKHPNRILSGNRTQMTYPEQVAFDYLTSRDIKFAHQLKVGKYYPDFVIDKTIIEIDGKRWHNKDKDAKRDAELTALGYKVYRIQTDENIINRLNNILFGT